MSMGSMPCSRLLCELTCSTQAHPRSKRLGHRDEFDDNRRCHHYHGILKRKNDSHKYHHHHNVAYQLPDHQNIELEPNPF